MKVYVLNALINNHMMKDKMFTTRQKANKYLEKILDKNNLVVDEVIYKDNNHSQEFICNDYNRIFINREIINL
ncbi:MAG: hypothetical protein SOU19_03010 [Candidatus Caccosoma sp.]|nr:hypothetical protein [Candidatus Caccosoma sp.]